MADLFDCLQSAIDAGLAPAARARQAQGDYRDLVAKYSTHYPAHIAQGMAAADLKVAAQRGAAARRHTVLAQLQTARRNTALMTRSADPTLAPLELIEGKVGTGNTYESVRFTQGGLRRQFMGMIREALAVHGPDIAGRPRNRARLAELVRELHGQASGSVEAKRMADAVRAAQARARTLFNAHGGNIGELADFGLPHAHDTAKLRAAGFDAWRREVEPRLAWNRIEDATTGKPFAAAGAAPDPARAARFLEDVYSGIVTRNLDELVPSMGGGAGKALANRRADHRVLHFRDADDWMEYNDRFGLANPFQAMVGHLEGMARDIALMRVLGPNPRAGLEHAIQTAQKELSTRFDAARAAAGTDPAKLAQVAKDQRRSENRMKRRSKRARAMLGGVTGANNVPEDELWGAFFAGTRNLLTAAQLGGAMLSSLSDMWTMRMAAAAVGMNPRGTVVRQMQLIASSATRETAAQMGYVADTLANGGSAAARYMGDVWSPEITGRITDAVLRASGLSYWTDMGRTAFQMEFSGLLASQAGRALADVEPALRRTLMARGITAADWDRLRDPAAMFTAPNGATFITPLHWVEHTPVPRAEAEGIAARLAGIIDEQMEFAVPSVSLEGRSMLLGESAPGSFAGELLRSGLMYKSFGLSVLLNQIRRTMAQPTGMARATYAASMIAGLTVLGAGAVQLKALAAGRDPRPMDSATFWGAAFLQGGGIGIFGDFLSSETARTGGGFAETLAGPVVGLGSDATRLVVSNAVRAVQGENTFVGRDVSNILRRYTPGTTLWQIRTPLDRLIWDQLQRLLDPEAEGAWALQERNRERAGGNETWWERGARAPERAPDLSTVTGGQR